MELIFIIAAACYLKLPNIFFKSFAEFLDYYLDLLEMGEQILCRKTMQKKLDWDCERCIFMTKTFYLTIL